MENPLSSHIIFDMHYAFWAWSMLQCDARKAEVNVSKGNVLNKRGNNRELVVDF